MSASAIRALIVDDEPKARRGIRVLLERDPEIEVVGECGTVDEAVTRIGETSPDLLYLDIQMPGPDGFETLRRIEGEKRPWVIFVTAHEQYALEAFDADAVDYLLKPYSDRRFADALERAKRQIRFERAERLERRIRDAVAEEDSGASPRGHSVEGEDGYARRFVVRESGRIFFVDVERIRWIEAAGHYVRLHGKSESYLVRSTLGEIEERLDPDRFVRIHRSTIVCLDAVEEFALWDKGHYVAILDSGERLRVSRSGFRRLEARLGNRL